MIFIALSRAAFDVSCVQIPSSEGLLAHSDGDVVLHATSDALLGAMGLGDIGQYFPDTEEEWANASSLVFILAILKKLAARGLQIVNLDVTILAERPKLAPHRVQMCKSLADCLQVGLDCVNLKATTMEGLGPVGEGLAMACHAVVLLNNKESL